MTARELFQIAYRAGRVAKRSAETSGRYHYQSTLSAGLEATDEYRDCPARFRIVLDAANTSEMSRAFRMRDSMRVMPRPMTAMKLANLQAVLRLKRKQS
jgi:hypothetical protein